MDSKLSIFALVLSIITLSIYITTELNESHFKLEMDKIVSEKLNIIKAMEMEKMKTTRIDACLLEQIDSINSILGKLQTKNSEIEIKIQENRNRSNNLRNSIGSNEENFKYE